MGKHPYFSTALIWHKRNKLEIKFGKITLIDRTDELGILTIAGPKARDVLSALTDIDLSNQHSPWLSVREIVVAGISLITLRLSFTGESAFELHAPNDQLGTLWDLYSEPGNRMKSAYLAQKP